MASGSEESSTAVFSHGSEDELVRELLDDESPFLLLPTTAQPQPQPATPDHSQRHHLKNFFLSNLFSGPTIQDIASVLSINNSQNSASSGADSDLLQTRISLVEKGSAGKMENNYTLRVKSTGSTIADDGYKWRKYGQKSIKNSPNPRSYYRCTNQRCSAKKQVERSMEDANTLIITYTGLHLHFTYSDFHINPPHHQKQLAIVDESSGNINDNHPSPKRLRTSNNHDKPLEKDHCNESPSLVRPTCSGGAPQPQGLLEDVVPLLIRKPTKSNSGSRGDPCFSPIHPSSPLLSTASSSSSSPFDHMSWLLTLRQGV